jgi:hypothetical protein
MLNHITPTIPAHIAIIARNSPPAISHLYFISLPPEIKLLSLGMTERRRESFSRNLFPCFSLLSLISFAEKDGRP